MFGIFRIIQGLVGLKGDTDGTKIGNTGDRLKVDAISSVPTISNKLRIDLSSTSISVPSSNFVTLYSYNGSGNFFGTLLEFNNGNIDVRLTIDGEVIYTLNVNDVENAQIDQDLYAGFIRANSSNYFESTFKTPIEYSASILIEAKKSSGVTKQMEYIVTSLTKES